MDRTLTTTSVTSPGAFAAALIGAMLCAAAVLHAEEAKTTVRLAPMRYAWVDGDLGAFRAHHWMREGAGGGIEHFDSRMMLPGNIELTSEGHALWHDHDLATSIGLRKEDLGFLHLDFSEFRKYYDDNGATYQQFATFTHPTTDKELALDIGEFSLETGLTLPDWPALTFGYAREYKDGAKSRLTLTPVVEGTTTRNIGPSWQDVDEIVDVFSLAAEHELAGFALRGEQRWELVRSELFREERSFSTNTGASSNSQKKLRRQDQAPETTLMTTTLGGERRFFEDKLFLATGYHYAHMNNREFESLLEFNESGVLTAFSNPKMQVDARADNDYDSHTWTGNVQTALRPWLSLGTKLKSEVVRRDSNSTYPADAAEASSTGGTPDGIIDRFDNSITQNKVVRWGEALTLRMTAIPRTALYTELEFEQARVLMREDRKSLDGPDAGNGVSAGEVFNRETVTDVRRGAFTLGGQFAPWPFLTMTSHVRHRRHNNDYDDQRESAGTGGARSAFIDRQHVNTDEFITRLTLRPCRWFRSAFRYQFRDDDYGTAVEAQSIVKTGMRSHRYTYDVTLQPLRQLVTTASFSRQDAVVTTPADASSTRIPDFNADVHTWLLTMDYVPTAPVTLTTSLAYSRAANFDETYLFAGLPLGADFERVDATSAMRWAVRDDLSVGAEYAFYHYQANENAGTGDYSAHVIWLNVETTF